MDLFTPFADVSDDLLANFLFNKNVLFQILDFLPQTSLLNLVQPIHRRKFSSDISLSVLNLKLAFNISLIQIVLKHSDVFSRLPSLFGVFILFFLKVLIDLLDHLGVLPLLLLELFILLLFLDVIFNLLLEHAILWPLIVLQLPHDINQHVLKVGLVHLDKSLVAADIGVVLELAAQLLGLSFELV